MEKRKPGQCVTPMARFSYVSVFEPSETPASTPQNPILKYSACVMVPKEDKEGYAMLNKVIQEAVAKGLETNKFPKAKVKSLRLPIRDGDKEYDAGDRGPEFKGFWFFNASSKNQPGVVENTPSGLSPILDTDNFFSGCWGRAHVSFFPYNTAGNVGIGTGLNNIMKSKEDERLDGRISAEQAFGEYAELESAEGETAGDLE